MKRQKLPSALHNEALSYVDDVSCIVDECSLTTALDWSPEGRRRFQIISVHSVSWGHLNWYDAPLPSHSVSKVIGRPLASLPIPWLLAAIDGVMRRLVDETRASSIVKELVGSLHDKSNSRHEFIVTEVELLARTLLRKSLKDTSLATVGYFRELDRLYRSHFARFRWRDMSLGTKPFEPRDGDDVVLVSGAAYVNGSMDAILAACRRQGIATVVLAQSCPNILPLLLENRCDLLIRERFPFFFLDGLTQLSSYRWYESRTACR